MQTVANTKKKYNIDDFVSSERANPIIQNFSQKSNYLICICKNITHEGQTCFKCKQFTHNCIINKPNRENLFECSRCLNKSLDPLYQVKKVLVQTYFKTYSIFTYTNTVNFQFNLSHQDISSSMVQIRGIIPGNTGLAWPMQGGFAINEDKNFHEFKPLMSHSNRKSRRQQYFTIPSDKLKLGKNFLKFKIPCLDKYKFSLKFQCQEKKIYYIAINLITKLTPSELQTKTFRERRTQKNQSLQILKINNSDIQITQNKVCLMCPYSKQRIKVPIRGRYCQHFSCICLQTLIASHSSSRYWGCPICDQRINEPYVDVWIYNMLIDNQKGSQVLIKLDGTYEWLKQNENIAMSLESDQQSQPYRPQIAQIEKGIEKPILVAGNKKEVKGINVIDIQDDLEIVTPAPQVIAKQISSLQKIPKKSVNNKSQAIQKPQNKEIDLSFMISEQEDQLIQHQAQKKEVFAKIRQKMTKQNPNTMTQNIMRSNTKSQIAPKQSFPQNKKGRNSLEPEPRIDKRNEEPKTDRFKNQINSLISKKTFLQDVRTLEARELRLEEFKRMHSKGKTNKYKKYAQVQQLRKLFKQIL